MFVSNMLNIVIPEHFFAGTTETVSGSEHPLSATCHINCP